MSDIVIYQDEDGELKKDSTVVNFATVQKM